MHSALFYLVGLTLFALVVGGVVTFVALRNAPEGFEGEDGFVGVTRGDELLLKEYEARQQYASAHPESGMPA